MHAAPEHHEYSTSQDFEDFEFYLNEGAVFEVFIGGRWAGVFSGYRQVDACLNGFLVTENLLTSEFRSRGFGPAVQWLTAQHLSAAYDVMFGTIHVENLGAYNAARSSGRVDIGGFNWVFVK